jgi:phosphoesterase RecJ-like protein
VVDAKGHALFTKMTGSLREVVLTAHMHPDGDALGAQLGLAAFLMAQGVDVTIINPDPVAKTLEFMVDKRHEVQTWDPETHTKTLAATSLIILLDNSAPDRLGRMEEVMLANAEKVLCIDHHPTRYVPWKDLILDRDSSATAAMIHELVIRAGWQPDLPAAVAMFVGLSTDTGFFRFNSTNATAHRIAADLLDVGVDTATCYQEVNENNSPAYTRLMGSALAGLRMDGEGAVASVRIDAEMQNKLEAWKVDTSEMTTPMLAVSGVRIALLFRDTGDGNIKVSLRSKGAINVHGLALKYGGGGHPNASGIVMEETLDKAAESLIEGAVRLLHS